jgi:hypothetical protein
MFGVDIDDANDEVFNLAGPDVTNATFADTFAVGNKDLLIHMNVRGASLLERCGSVVVGASQKNHFVLGNGNVILNDGEIGTPGTTDEPAHDCIAIGGGDIAGTTNATKTTNSIAIGNSTISAGVNRAIAIGNITISTSNYVGLGGNRVVTNTDLQFTDGTLINDRLDVSSTQNIDGSGYYSVDTSSGDVTLTIQTSENVDGKEINVKNNGSGTVTIETQGSSTIDDSTNATIPIDNNAVTLVYNSTNDDWEIY